MQHPFFTSAPVGNTYFGTLPYFSYSSCGTSKGFSVRAIILCGLLMSSSAASIPNIAGGSNSF